MKDRLLIELHNTKPEVWENAENVPDLKYNEEVQFLYRMAILLREWLEKD